MTRNMTVRQLVTKLQSQGHKVTYYVRKDGGILIKSIDGERFTTGASGNTRARQLLGVELSEAREYQLKYATRQRGRPRFKLDKDIEEEYQRVKKLWNKKIKSKKGRPHPAGYFGKRGIEWSYKKYGKEENMKKIREAERYAMGIAHTKNVQYLIVLINDYAIKNDSEELRQLAIDVELNSDRIREEWIVPAYEELYKLNAGVPPKEVARNTRKILRL